MRVYLIAAIGGFSGGVVYSAIKDLFKWFGNHKGGSV